MFSASGTNTPIPYNANTPFHEQLGETVTWIRDWYSPNLDLESDSTIDTVKLKGWFKTNINHKNDPSIKLSINDTLDIEKWKYLPPVEKKVVVEAEEKKVEADEKVEEETELSKELLSAISMETDEGGIAGLSWRRHDSARSGESGGD